ncbi:LacI family DNA-binding transcriptional regulator [Litorivicinus lipolyticus]|uniref:LacI family DNA-binding transcriptional regulator n=1 Tax=Litorivicinus lipolyticus TaxID=418701 RepID=UPI003B5BF15C
MTNIIKNMEGLAQVSGVSRPTVSKYFNDPDSVRASTRKRIEAAIEAHDYRPNIYAINQNRKLTKTVGIVVPHLADPFFAEIARSTEQLCIEAGYSPTMYSSYGDPKQEIEILESLRSLKPAGVLLAPLGHDSDRARLQKFCKAVPTVLVDSNIEGLGEAFIGSDNESFVNQTVEYLIRTGEPPLFFEMATPSNPNARKRHETYLAKMDRMGFEPHVVAVAGDGWDFEEIGYRGAHELLDRGQLPSNTILCSNDRLAIGFLAAAYERGLTVGRMPGDQLRLASNDDHPYAKFTCPSLTTAAHDYDAVTTHSVRTLFERIEQGCAFASRDETRYPARLVLRNSS